MPHFSVVSTAVRPVFPACSNSFLITLPPPRHFWSRPLIPEAEDTSYSFIILILGLFYHNFLDTSILSFFQRSLIRQHIHPILYHSAQNSAQLLFCPTFSAFFLPSGPLRLGLCASCSLYTKYLFDTSQKNEAAQELLLPGRFPLSGHFSGFRPRKPRRTVIYFGGGVRRNFRSVCSSTRMSTGFERWESMPAP